MLPIQQAANGFIRNSKGETLFHTFFRETLIINPLSSDVICTKVCKQHKNSNLKGVKSEAELILIHSILSKVKKYKIQVPAVLNLSETSLAKRHLQRKLIYDRKTYRRITEVDFSGSFSPSAYTKHCSH